MQQHTKVNLHNRFDIEIKDSRTGKVKQKAYAENIILNQAWEQILSADDWFDRIYYGTGTGTIAASRTELFTPLSNKVALSPVYSGDKNQNWYSLRQSITLLETEHVGSVLTEVGVGTASVLCTHALLKDMNGNQVSITKTDVDIITIYATVYVRPSTTWSVNSEIDIVRNDISHNPLIRTLLGRHYYVDDGGFRYINWDYVLGVFTGDVIPPYESYEYVSAVTPMSIDVENRRATFYTRIPADSANVGGLRTYVLMGYKTYQYGGTHYIRQPSIVARLRPETVTESIVTEQIGTGDGITTDFSTTFPFVKSGAVIKVDGATVSPTVITGVPNKRSVKFYVRNVTNPDFPDSLYQFDNWQTAAAIMENPYYQTHGIASITGARVKISASDDAVNWEEAYTTDEKTTQSARSIPAQYQNKRFWKFEMISSSTWIVSDMECSPSINMTNVRFESAPATGAVITAEYEADVATKDANHVLDVTIVIQLGEDTP